MELIKIVTGKSEVGTIPDYCDVCGARNTVYMKFRNILICKSCLKKGLTLIEEAENESNAETN